MSPTVAYRQFLSCRRNNRSAKRARDQYMVPPKGACRDRRENSNAAIVRALDGSGFFALTSSAAVEIFSAKGVPRAYPGANPNVRSKRLA